MRVDGFEIAEIRLRALAPAQLRSAVPLLADMGHHPEQIRAHLLADLHSIRAHAQTTGALPHRVFGEHAARYARLENAGVRLATD